MIFSHSFYVCSVFLSIPTRIYTFFFFAVSPSTPLHFFRLFTDSWIEFSRCLMFIPLQPVKRVDIISKKAIVSNCEVVSTWDLLTNIPSSFLPQDPTYFPGRQADVYYNGKVVGTFGILHPEVVANFDIVNPCSAFEICVEPFL